MYSVPPWPSLAASMAAYRLRSFSESESWNIRIECSISGLYVMSGRPLQGLDRPCYRYTIRTGNREVIESAILKGCTKSQISPIIQHESPVIRDETQALPLRPDSHPVETAQAPAARGQARRPSPLGRPP